MAISRLDFDLCLGIDNIQVRQLSWHHLSVKKLGGNFFVITEVNFEGVVIIAQDILEVGSKLAHKLLGPRNKKDRFRTFFGASVLVLKLGHICVKDKLNVICSLKA